ncbi:putative ATP-dependent RNA helicase DHX57 isoform X1 [Maniola jurtina]|uniref:putative ATP-dependent RNA helicase DHX57 isoform X1 n=1 Tax=Maniola jurtina TaxID=191418 RepID=UPI001E68C1C4|nr:putative ATP-dependent RNA helicase DHX57 isoform X1 [Maniola jurtina]
MDYNSRQLAEDTFLRVPVDARVRKHKDEQEEESHPSLKVEMQTIRLNPDSQKLVLDTLRFIHGQDFKLESSSSYKDKGSNLGNRFWMERGNLVVRGGCDYSLTPKPDIKSSETRLREFALSKLAKYCFHKPHCAEALENAAENVDSALEILFMKYFNVTQQEKPENIPSKTELLEMRMDEKAVLESIYENSFKANDANIWTVNLDLDYLTNVYKSTDAQVPKKREDKNTNFKTKKKEACKLFLRGSCRFGAKCKFSHETEAENKRKEIAYTDSEKVSYELEIMFPENSLYPYEPPVLFFKPQHSSSLIPELTCLRITARLYDEAKILAQDGVPSIYTLVELLNNEEDILNFIKFDTRKFPEPFEALFPQLIENSNSKKVTHPSHYKKGETKDRSNINFNTILKENSEIVRWWLDKRDNNKYHKMLSSRKKLPAWKKRKEILDAMDKSQVIVISGETGCGKSTQVPQYILDDWLDSYSHGGREHVDIVCTQPRRISAIGVADRVAEERVERTGQIVGYQIRLESKVSSKTRLTFCTTGILLRRLEYDPQLQSITHILVDEVHERSEESDFLLLILKDLIKVRKDLTIVLMSATMNADLFSGYFNKVPVIEIPGRTFPVEQLFLDDVMDITNYVLEENGPYARKVKKGDREKRIDFETEFETCDVKSEATEPPKASIRDENLSISQMVARYPNCSKLACKNLYLMDTEKINLDLVEHVLTYIVEGDHSWPREGAILIFLPGIGEIMSLHDQLAESHTFSPNTGKYVLVPLHSTLSSEEQARVFKKPRPGARKIVLSTNIAETSVTIDDCVFVVDCGRMKEKRFDSNRNMESLDLVWVSRANAKQRRGRAGRVMPGVCIHLFTSHRYTHHFAEQPVPEIHRVPLEQLLLKLKILPLFQNMNVHEVLGKTIEPPLKSNIDGALTRLQDVGALDKSFVLTALGKHLAALPVDVRIGKLMLFGAIFCCVDSALTMAAFLSHKSPFVAPFGKKTEADAKRREFACSNSDQLTTLRAYRRWQQALKSSTHAALVFSNEHFLSHKTLMMLADIKHQLLGLLASIGFVPDMPALRRKMRKDSVASLTGDELNCNGNNDKLLAAILCAALYPNVVKVLTPEKAFHMQASGAIPRQPTPDELKFKTKSDGYVALHPSSVNSTIGYFASPYLVYQEKVKTSRVFIRECSMVPQLPLVLFSGCTLAVELHNGTFIVSLEDGWIMFQVEKHEVAEMLKTIRVELINLLEEKIKDPSLDLLHYEKGNKIIKTIVQIISKD